MFNLDEIFPEIRDFCRAALKDPALGCLKPTRQTTSSTRRRRRTSKPHVDGEPVPAEKPSDSST